MTAELLESQRTDFAHRLETLAQQITEAEQERGQAVARGDTAATKTARSKVERLEAEQRDLCSGISALDQQIEASAGAEIERGFDQRRLEMYDYYANMLPIQADAIRQHRAYVAAWEELHRLEDHSAVESHRRALRHAGQPFEVPARGSGKASDNPDACDVEADRFRALAEALRAKLCEGGEGGEDEGSDSAAGYTAMTFDSREG